MYNIQIGQETIKFEVIDGRPMISSLDVARRFDKRHSDVIRIIENDEFYKEDINERNLSLSEYKDLSGNKRKKYFLSRDAFTYYVLGFTGIKGKRWRRLYIKAFNKMEELINNNLLIGLNSIDTETAQKLINGLYQVGEKNKQGFIKNKLVSSYARADKRDPTNMLIAEKKTLEKLINENSFFAEELRQRLKEIEKQLTQGGHNATKTLPA